MAGVTWRELSAEEIAAYEADPRTAEYRAQQARAASNARPHCPCGLFVKVSTVRQSRDSLVAECVRCGPVTL